MEFFKNVRINMTINAVLTFIIGVIFIFNPYGASSTIAIIAGIAILVAGVIDIGRYFMAHEYEYFSSGSFIGGIVKCLLGIFAITHTGLVLSLLSYILSIFVILCGASCLESSVQLKRGGISLWSVNMVLSVLIFAAGVFMLIFPFDAISTALMIIGVILIIGGLNEFYTSYRMRKLGNDLKKFQRRF